MRVKKNHGQSLEEKLSYVQGEVQNLEHKVSGEKRHKSSLIGSAGPIYISS